MQGPDGYEPNGGGEPSRPYERAAAIVARIPMAEARAEMAAMFRGDMSAFERLSPASQEDIAGGVERNLRRWWEWLSTGTPPADRDFDPLREWARARATEGVRLEDLLRAFGVGGQIGWELMRRHATAGEADALLDAAGLLMRYIDRITTIVTDTYLAEREVLVSEEERRTRNLLESLSAVRPLDAGELELAERLGVPIEESYVPFAIVMPGRSPRRHAALAARLRNRGWRLAVTEGDRVVGLAWQPLELADLDEGPDVLLVIGSETGRDQLGDARDELVLLAEHGRRAGLRGRVQVEDHLPEVLVLRSPRAAAALRARVVAPLAEPGHEELLRTLAVLVARRFDRSVASAELHIHRNTLGYRLRRIEEITGLDLESPRDLTCVYLALVHAHN